jgi:hypothetical protein
MHMLLLAILISFPVYAQDRVKENIKQMDGVQLEDSSAEIKEEPQKKPQSKPKTVNDEVRKQ